MPNHVKNVLTIKGIKSKDIPDLLEKITTPLDEDNPDDILNRIFDFDKIIPEPKTKEECPEDCWVTPSSHVMEDKEKPWFDWYAWHIKHWGTKWNAYDGYIIIKPSSITFVFSTAWNMPEPVYNRLVKTYNEYDMELKYADEDWGSNCGHAVHHKEDWCSFVYYDMDTRFTAQEKRNWAKRLWDNY